MWTYENMLIIYVVVLIKCLSSKIMYYACTHTMPKFMIDRILTVRVGFILFMRMKNY